MAVENHSSNNDVSSSCLPPGLLEYISTWNNENIANEILLENYLMNKKSQNNQEKETKAIEKKETLKKEIKEDKIANYKNETIASREQASFKIFGFEFAPVFIPIERRLQVLNRDAYVAKILTIL